jgi:hypothetical protein
MTGGAVTANDVGGSVGAAERSPGEHAASSVRVAKPAANHEDVRRMIPSREV